MPEMIASRIFSRIFSLSVLCLSLIFLMIEGRSEQGIRILYTRMQDCQLYQTLGCYYAMVFCCDTLFKQDKNCLRNDF